MPFGPKRPPPEQQRANQHRPPPPPKAPPPPRVVGPAAPRRHVDKPKPDPAEGYRVPEEQEHELRKAARKQYPGDKERQDAFVYGTMRKQGWKPEHHSPWDGKTYKHWYFGKKRI